MCMHGRNVLQPAVIDLLQDECSASENKKHLVAIYNIYKEELKTNTQPNCHETLTAIWNPYRRVSSKGDVHKCASAEEHAAKS